MRPASLFCVCLLAKLLVVDASQLELSLWTPFALLWQDVVYVLLIAGVERLIRRDWACWSIYAANVAYIAGNVPLARATSSPLTWPMLRAADATISDSILRYLTPVNIGLLAVIAVTAALLPRRFEKLKPRAWRVLVMVAVGVACCGPAASIRVGTQGMDRNFVAALLLSGRATVPLANVTVDAQNEEHRWRISPAGPGDVPHDDLTEFGGAAGEHNVILVVLESAAAQYLKPYGADHNPMPHLTKLASRSLVFDRAYAVYPESIKGLVAVLSSRWPAMFTEAEEYSDFGRESIASILAAAGYRTGLFHSGRFGYLGMESVIHDRGFDTLEDAASISGVHNSSFGVDEPSTVGRILSWIDEVHGRQPFFVTYLPVAGHHPYDTPEAGPFPEEEDIGRYRNALHYSDAAIGQLLDGLDDRGLSDQTMVVVVGDHGQAFGQHANNYGHTFFLYDENVRVPLMISWPSLDASVRVSRPVSVVDVAPTICDLLGVESAAEFVGQSLLHARPTMPLLFTDYSLGFVGLVDGPWKFIHDLDSSRSQLFDLRSDSGERENIAASYPDRVLSYERHLKDWAAVQRAMVRQ